jgi:hypothetical protein
MNKEIENLQWLLDLYKKEWIGKVYISYIDGYYSVQIALLTDVHNYKVTEEGVYLIKGINYINQMVINDYTDRMESVSERYN